MSSRPGSGVILISGPGRTNAKAGSARVWLKPAGNIHGYVSERFQSATNRRALRGDGGLSSSVKQWVYQEQDSELVDYLRDSARPSSRGNFVGPKPTLCSASIVSWSP